MTNQVYFGYISNFGSCAKEKCQEMGEKGGIGRLQLRLRKRKKKQSKNRFSTRKKKRLLASSSSVCMGIWVEVYSVYQN